MVTYLLPGAQNRVPPKPASEPVLTVVAGFPRYPPELAYPPIPHTTEPAVVLGESGRSRTAYFSGDVERTYWLTSDEDIVRLLHNTIRWLTRDERVVEVDGEGFIEMLAWETGPGYTVHMLNYTNPNAHHGWMQAVYPLGEQTVRMKLPAGVRAKTVELLCAGDSVRYSQQGQMLAFTVPRIGDYEVAAITVA
jgi:hypothetical protein